MRQNSTKEGQSCEGYDLPPVRSYLKELALQGLRGSRKLKPGALSLYVSDGHRAAVEAIGSYNLFSRNNVVYFSAIPRNGIFEIDFSNFNTNDSSMYVVSNKRAKTNLDSTLLWHCRLGHISKKHIEKLQHDGLLNSTNNQSFDKCISCMYVDKLPSVSQCFDLEVEELDCLGPSSDFLTICWAYWITHVRANYGVRCRGGVSLMAVEMEGVRWGEEEGVLGLIRGGLGSRNAEFLKNSLITQEASGSLEDLEIIQEEDTHPTVNTSLDHDEDDQEIDEPQSDINTILGDHNEPANYKDALLDPKSEKWLDAMNVEMQSIKDNKVWDLVDLPPNARLIAKGFTQTCKVDYEETFSTVADIRAIRILVAIVAFYDYKIWQMDVKTAFLNRHLSKEVYMVQPQGFVNPKYLNRVCKLERSIYGLKQASKPWNKRFDDEIKKFGFTQNRDEPCVYKKSSGSNVTFLILYVDDKLIMENHFPMLQDVKSYLRRCFAMKDLGEAAYILGIKIYNDQRRFNCIFRNTKDIVSVYGGDIRTRALGFYYNDAGYLTDADELNTKQSIFATSSLEAGCIAAYDASKEAVWIRKFIYGLGVVPKNEEPITMYCDNTEAIPIANESAITKCARHYRAKFHYLREAIELGDVKIEKDHTNDNLADPFTKALPLAEHSEHTQNIRMLPASSLM
ncbi:retrotransposon protein, putative, ty1-copia subclass [Tanacetum coccineum]